MVNEYQKVRLFVLVVSEIKHRVHLGALFTFVYFKDLNEVNLAVLIILDGIELCKVTTAYIW